MGKAINKAVQVREIVKRRVKGLHQITEVLSTQIVDEWEPLEEGLKKLQTTRTVSSVHITLSLKPLDTNHYGYQPPIPEEQVKPEELEEAEESEEAEVQF